MPPAVGPIFVDKPLKSCSFGVPCCRCSRFFLGHGRDTSQLAVHLSNDNAMRRLLRDGVGINEVQKKYLSLCYVSFFWPRGVLLSSGCIGDEQDSLCGIV